MAANSNSDLPSDTF